MMKQLLLFTCFALFLCSCYKDQETSTDTVVIETTETLIQNTVVLGICLDESGNLLSDVPVEFADKNKTGETPYFFFETGEINRYYEPIGYMHPEGMKMYSSLSNVENTVNYHSLYIPTSFQNYQYSTNNTLKIPLDTDVEINIAEEALIEDGTKLEGNYEILLKVLDPSSLSDSRIIPNHFVEDQYQVKSFLDIEEAFYLGIAGAANQSTSFQADKMAVGLDNDLYFFDGEQGFWVAKDEDENYESGYYATGTMLASTIQLLQVDTHGDILGFTAEIQREQEVSTLVKLTENGKAIFHLPQNQEVKISLANLGQTVKEQTVSTNEDKVDIELEIFESNVKKLSVDIRDCSDSKQESGILFTEINGYQDIQFVETDNLYRIYQPEGEVVTTSLLSTDFLTHTQSISLPIEGDIKLGRQYLCDEISDSYVVYYIEDNFRVLTNNSSSVVGTETNINGFLDSGELVLSLKFRTDQVGEVTDDLANILLDDPMLGQGYKLNCFTTETGCGFEEAYITSIDKNLLAEGFLKGTFKGNFWVESVLNENVGYRFINGEFQVKL
ncbi:hypothetical protein N9B82_04285 [Saprospiraceae bacterium]|nr:hypothetical protein [Saprospiraceae bacterium]